MQCQYLTLSLRLLYKYIQLAAILCVSFLVLLVFHMYLITYAHVGTYDWLLNEHKDFDDSSPQGRPVNKLAYE